MKQRDSNTGAAPADRIYFQRKQDIMPTYDALPRWARRIIAQAPMQVAPGAVALFIRDAMADGWTHEDQLKAILMDTIQKERVALYQDSRRSIGAMIQGIVVGERTKRRKYRPGSGA